MKFNKKKLLFTLAPVIISALATAGIVYANASKVKSLNRIYLPGSLYSPLSFLYHGDFKMYDSGGYEEINENIWLTYHDVYGDGNTRSKIKAFARAILDYSYQPYKTNIFRQDYVDWNTQIQSYVEFVNGQKFVLNGIEQTLNSNLSGIGTPSLAFGLSSKPSINFNSTLNISGKTISETLWAQNSPELNSESKNRAWIWSLWSFSQSLNARYRAKSTSLSYRSKPAPKLLIVKDNK